MDTDRHGFERQGRTVCVRLRAAQPYLVLSVSIRG